MMKEEFIKAVTEKYEDKYDCSGVNEEHIKYQANAPIRCSKHGTFYTTPYQLLHGLIGGCFECYKEKHWGDKGRGL